MDITGLLSSIHFEWPVTSDATSIGGILNKYQNDIHDLFLFS